MFIVGSLKRFILWPKRQNKEIWRLRNKIRGIYFELNEQSGRVRSLECFREHDEAVCRDHLIMVHRLMASAQMIIKTHQKPISNKHRRALRDLQKDLKALQESCGTTPGEAGKTRDRIAKAKGLPISSEPKREKPVLKLVCEECGDE
jgi:hypothetical protein